MRKLMNLPRPVLRLLAGVLAGGLAAVAMRLPQVASWSGRDVAAMALLAGLTVAGEHLHVDVRFGDQTKHVSVSEAFYGAALLLGVRPSVLTLGVGLGVLGVYGSRRIAWYKTAYNAGSFVLAVTAAELVFRAASPVGMLAVVPAMAAFFAVNSSSVVGVIALAEGRSFGSVFGPIAPLEFGHVAVNLGFGVALANVWTFAPAMALVLASAPAAAMLAHRATARHRHHPVPAAA